MFVPGGIVFETGSNVVTAGMTTISQQNTAVYRRQSRNDTSLAPRNIAFTETGVSYATRIAESRKSVVMRTRSFWTAATFFSPSDVAELLVSGMVQLCRQDRVDLLQQVTIE